MGLDHSEGLGSLFTDRHSGCNMTVSTTGYRSCDDVFFFLFCVMAGNLSIASVIQVVSSCSGSICNDGLMMLLMTLDVELPGRVLMRWSYHCSASL